jgi:ubiquinone/menaquinone biosynthesis C-methylase UbiE
MNNFDNSIFIDPATKEKLSFVNGNYKNKPGHVYTVKNDIPNFIFPTQLPAEVEHSKNFYEGRAQQYDSTLHLTFFTHSEKEEDTRNKFIDKLNLKSNSKVLEIACGTGRDSLLLAKRLSKEGELHVQDISEDMISRCYEKLKDLPLKKSICLSNANYLPYPDNYFDALYSFGAMGEFSDKKQVFSEMVRVTKKGGKIVVGDESVPVWYRNTEFYKILLKTNPMFEAEVPFADIPIEARNVSIQWVIGGTFYLIDFEVGEGEPTANFDFQIPGERGGTYRTRYEGQLEGVTKETKQKVLNYIRSHKISMHDWLEKIIKEAVEKK